MTPCGMDPRFLWITHRQELLDQTADTFARCAPILADARDRFAMRLIGGGYGPASTIPDSGHDVVVATIAALSYDMPAVNNNRRAARVLDEGSPLRRRTW